MYQQFKNKIETELRIDPCEKNVRSFLPYCPAFVKRRGQKLCGLFLLKKKIYIFNSGKLFFIVFPVYLNFCVYIKVWFSTFRTVIFKVGSGTHTEATEALQAAP